MGRRKTCSSGSGRDRAAGVATGVAGGDVRGYGVAGVELWVRRVLGRKKVWSEGEVRE